MASSPEPEVRQPVQLPRSSTRLARQYAYVKLLSGVRADPFGSAFEGALYKPGAVLSAELAGANPIALECVGPIGSAWKGKGVVRREWLYILWRYLWEEREWVEIARAQSVGPEWTLALRPAAIAALHPRPELVDVGLRSVEVAALLMVAIDKALESQPAGVQARVLHSLYEGMAGRIAALA